MLAALNSLPQNLRASLSGPLSQTAARLIDNNPKYDVAACNTLSALIQQLNVNEARGRLTAAEANALRQAAEAIRASLGCP